MKIGIVVQARMSARRFPGKMIAEFNGHAVIDWVLYRLNKVRAADELILATSTNLENDVLVRKAKAHGVSVFQGSEDDVLGRFVDVSSHFGLDRVVRVCADNPLVCPGEIDKLIDFFDAKTMDYAFNGVPKMDNRYPDGLGAEITTADVLADMNRRVESRSEREHIFNYLWEHPDQYRIATFSADAAIALPNIRLDIDTRDDLDYLSAFVFTMDDPAAEIIRKIQQREQSK